MRTATAATTISATVIPTAIRGLRLATIPITAATTTNVTPIPTVSAVLSFCPNVWIANSFSHSGVSWMNDWPSDVNGDAGVSNTPIHPPKASQQLGDADRKADGDDPDERRQRDTGSPRAEPGRGGIDRRDRRRAAGHARGSGRLGGRMGRWDGIFVALVTCEGLRRRLGHPFMVR